MTDVSTGDTGPRRRYRARLLIALVVVTPLGLFTKRYDGPGAGWVGAHLGGALYEVFWILAVKLLHPRLAAWKAAAGVFFATCLLELLQLWHPPFLEAIRSTWPGRTILGSTFGWQDFPWYALGAGVGWLVVALIERDGRTAEDIGSVER